MPEAVPHKIDERFGEGTYQANVFRRLEQMPEDFQERRWPIFDPEEPDRVRELFYPAVWAAMDVADNWARIKAASEVVDDKEK